MLQVLSCRNTCTSELPSKKAEVQFIFIGIVTRNWIMHARKGVNIIFCCEVCHLLSTVCLSNGSFNFAFVFTFRSKNFLLSLNCIAPTAMQGPPIRASYGRCKIMCCIGLKKLGGKIFSNLQSNTRAKSSIFSTSVQDNSLAQRMRKKLLNSASTSHRWSGR